MGTSLGLAVMAAPALAQTPAGTVINNTATATYDNPAGGSPVTITSNTVGIRVDELLDVSVAKQNSSAIVVQPSATQAMLTFKVTNEGNGEEAFTLVANAVISGDDFDPTVTSLVLDDGDGLYNATKDTVYVAGSNDPLLASGGSVTVFVLATIPAAKDSDRAFLSLSATAKTGSGAAGTVFAGKGAGGGDAVVGATKASDDDQGSYLVSDTQVSMVKSSTVVDPFGGSALVPGSTVTYTLTTTVTGTGTVTGLKVSDPVPAKTTYVTGSIALDGASQTDAAGDDAGEMTGGKVAVSLGSQGAGTRVVTFKVKVD